MPFRESDLEQTSPSPAMDVIDSLPEDLRKKNKKNGIDDDDDDDDDAQSTDSDDITTDSTLGWRETRRVKRLRFIVISFLLFASALVAFGLYKVLRNSEWKNFQDQFDDQATKVLDSFQYKVQRKLATFDALSIAMTSYGRIVQNDDVSPWPNVTLPSFAVLASDVQLLVDAIAVAYLPVVYQDENLQDAFITSNGRSQWEEYSVANQDSWIPNSLAYEQSLTSRRQLDTTTIASSISKFDPTLNAMVPLQDEDVHAIKSVSIQGQHYHHVHGHLPLWQSVPFVSELVNLDFLTLDSASELETVLESREALVGKIVDNAQDDIVINSFLQDAKPSPISQWYFPVFDTFQTRRSVVGIITAVMNWESYFVNVLPPDTPMVDVVLENDCGQIHTYRVTGQDVHYVGQGDFHDSSFKHQVQSTDIFTFIALSESIKKYKGVPLQEVCKYTLHVYPTDETKEAYLSTRPWLFVALVAGIFLLTIAILMCYDRHVEARQQIVLRKAEQAGAIVKSMFPAAVRRRLYEGDATNLNGVMGADMNAGLPSGMTGGRGKKGQDTAPFIIEPEKMKIKSFLSENPAAKEFAQLKAKTFSAGAARGPMADTFPATTILFADIVGFTAWSSEREPQQVFILLQTLYYNFDALAKKYLVFKVETIGDCYVAATGLPEPQPDHALRMARFAAQCLIKMNEVTRSLELSLGPDTGELRMRVGLHSGPVAAGVLKGAQTRFQLFGDTVNTAARMESNGQIGRIHCSGATAKLISSSGKAHWVKERDDIIEAKGKGQIQTYWIMPRSSGDAQDGDDEHEIEETTPLKVFDLSIQSSRQQRLVNWNVEVLSSLLKQIAAIHIDTGVNQKPKENPSLRLREGSTALNEVTEIIRLPEYDERVMNLLKTEPENIVLHELVLSELKDYVTTIASMYQPNAFHNFEHASHVTQSTSKLLKRIVMSDAAQLSEDGLSKEDLHTYSHGLATDPLTQFTLVFCALIHDVDHPGVSNFQLVAEETTLAQVYKNKSVAEQNSVDIAWDLLMDERYANLRRAIYCNQAELVRFRQMMVNIVLATDIFDKDMKAIRESRWAKAFSDDCDESSPLATATAAQRERDRPLTALDGVNLKATIVIEHLIQASDVSHCMQHFDIYMKWNERLFQEMYGAFATGRSKQDPSVGWFKGEMWFFDNYVIPLARKLDECGVFGAHSQEYLNYALQNRKRFAVDGERITEEFKTRYDEELQKGKKQSLNETIHA